jgi:hypothetical protein
MMSPVRVIKGDILNLLPVVELVAEVVRGHNVQEEDVLGLGVQAGHLELHLWEHLPGKKVEGLNSDKS